MYIYIYIVYKDVWKQLIGEKLNAKQNLITHMYQNIVLIVKDHLLCEFP